MELLNKLYSMKYFGLFLIIAILVLVILFIVIMIFGKKDKKNRELEATAKLEALSASDGFKEEETKVAVDVEAEPKLTNDTIVIPTLNDMVKMDAKEETTPEIEPVNMEVTDTFESNSNEEEIKENEEIAIPTFDIEEKTEVVEEPTVSIPFTEDTVSMPVLEKEEESKFNFDDTTSYDLSINDSDDYNIEIPVDNKSEEQYDDTPVFDFDKFISEYNSINQEESAKEDNSEKEVFSSVFVPEETTEIELPEINIADEYEEEEDEIELPALKKEDNKKEKYDNFDINDISGETYSINKR